MPDHVDLPLAVLGPQVNIEDKHGVVDVAVELPCQHQGPGLRRAKRGNLLAVQFFSCRGVDDDEPDTWGWGDRSSVLVAKATHARSFGLLKNIEPAQSGV